MIELHEGDCIEVIEELHKKGVKVNGVITSPPYNTARNGSNFSNHEARYISHNDNMPQQEYIDWQVDLFNKMESILEKDGCILYNISYGAENTDTLWLLIADIIRNTNLVTADHLIWKKKTALPNNSNHNRVTRITENVFVFCRKSELGTFKMNKKVSSVSHTGQKFYENIYNFVEAGNNDLGEHTKKHKATYSMDLVEQLIKLYYEEESVILDPYMGTGTTGLACKKLNRSFIGIELENEYFKISEDRLSDMVYRDDLFEEDD